MSLGWGRSSVRPQVTQMSAPGLTPEYSIRGLGYQHSEPNKNRLNLFDQPVERI